MSASKLIRRIELDLKRRMRDRFQTAARQVPALNRRQDRPAPLFSSRTRLAPELSANGALTFRFVNQPVLTSLGEIDWQAPGPGAANQLRRMNLHYMEYLEGAPDTLWAALVSDWITENGTATPGAWRDSWNSYALSLRVVVWLQELVRREASLPADIVATVEDNAARQLVFLESNLETDLGGNHLIKNIKTLIWAGRYFDGAAADRWLEKGVSLLHRELGTQVLSDGMHYERSPAYHNQVFADLLECRHALGCDPTGGDLDITLANMAQATADLAHPDGLIAQFNDAGLSMAYGSAQCLAAFARLFGAAPTARGTFCLPKAGYAGLRTDTTYFVADCGPIAPDDLPAHGHGDVLSFEWSVYGQRIIVDQGVFEYVAGEKRAASRSASNHNTLCIDGSDQAEFFSAFRCGRRPNTDIIACELNHGRLVFEGRHDGFANLPDGPVHRRRFDASSAGLEIEDRIERQTDWPAQIRFLLHPDVRVEALEGGVRLHTEKAVIAVRSEQEIEVVPAVWWPDMGREETTTRLVSSLPPGEAVLRTSLVLEETR
ncbi:MAG: alginate lyase family protein [Pseudomonadota bacterium]